MCTKTVPVRTCVLIHSTFQDWYFSQFGSSYSKPHLITTGTHQQQCGRSVADPDPGSGTFLTSGSGIRKGKKSDLGSGINIPDHFSKSLETFLGLKYVNSLMRIRISDPEYFWPWIRDPASKNMDQGFGINIPDPQHCVSDIHTLYSRSLFQS